VVSEMPKQYCTFVGYPKMPKQYCACARHKKNLETILHRRYISKNAKKNQ
jgi:hypothetical protein